MDTETHAPNLTEKKTLLIATDSFLPRWDGIARFLLEITPTLKKHFNIIIAAPKFEGSISNFEGVRIVRFDIAKPRVADTRLARFKFSKVKKLVKSADIVWSQSLGPIGGLAMFYAKRLKKPLISFVHSVEWDLFAKSINRFKRTLTFVFKRLIPFLYNRCNLIMVPFDGMIDILERERIYAKKEVIYLGINVEKFVPPSSKEDAKKRIGLNPNNFVIGYLGRFGKEKDIPTLYSAFRKVNDEYPDSTLLLVGGDLKKNFDDMENVKVRGSVNDPIPYYQAMDIYVLPSHTETTSLTTMEAMSCGVPVVVTPVGYVEKYVENKFNGFTFPPGSDERLALILTKLIKEKDTRIDMGKAARKTITLKHSWRKTSKDIVDVLKRF